MSYWLTFLILFFCRVADLVTTRMLIPSLGSEINPIYRQISWTSIIGLNIAFCFTFAFLPVSAMILCALSLIVAIYNLRLLFK